MVKVKICGITNLEDGFSAINLGADYLGFVVEVPNADRSLDLEEAKPLFEQLKGAVPLVALTPLERGKGLAALCRALEPDAVQLLKEFPQDEPNTLYRPWGRIS